MKGRAPENGTFYLLTFGFLGGPPPPCLESAEADGDGVQNALADALYILTHGFLGGPPPAALPGLRQRPRPRDKLGVRREWVPVSSCP